jgi:geranylgeranyl diphosphate synthase type II
MQNVRQDQSSGHPTPKGSSRAECRGETTVPADWHTWFSEQARLVDAQISNHLNALKACLQPHSQLLDTVEYALTAGGKRLRPVVVLETSRLCGGNQQSAWPAALAIECIHTFSLIHDDLPAMDNDDLRRQASADMIVGQGADIAGERQPTDPDLIRFIHRNKTARLLESACRLGALTARASADEIESLAEYGRRLGLAFQISDDLLDRTGTTEDLGKRAGKDADGSKQTYPAAFGITESRRQARHEIEVAVAALAPFGVQAERLQDLAWYVIERNR